jgi:hypothetical protein
VQDTTGVASGEVLRVHSLTEGELPGERPLGPFGDNDLPAVAIVKGAPGLARQDAVLEGHLDAVGVGAGGGQLAEGLFAWAGASCPGEARVVSSGCESGEEDVKASGTLNRAACGPAWLAATDHWASPSSPGAGMLSGGQCACPVTRAAGGSRSRLSWAAVA